MKITRKNVFGDLYLMFFLICGLAVSCRNNPTDPVRPSGALEITSDSFMTFSGSSLQLRAITTLDDGTSSDVTAKAIWSASPGQVGTINQEGIFRALGNLSGREQIQATYRGTSATADVEITPRAESINILPAILYHDSDQPVAFKIAVAFPYGGGEAWVTEQAEWSINPGVAAEIDQNGVVTPVPGMSGIEYVSAKFQTLQTSAQERSKLLIGPQFRSPFKMVEIPAGSFTMGNDNSHTNQRPAHDVFTDAFEIGEHEITNAQYVTYLNAAHTRGQITYDGQPANFVFSAKAPHNYTLLTRFGVLGPIGFMNLPNLVDVFITYSDESENNPFQVVSGFEDYPVVRINWRAATAFCEFYGLRLPTEAEWEKACRGAQQLRFGTSTGELNHDLANYEGTGGLDIYEGLAPVGSFPPNPFGLYDMCGNAADMVFDVYDPSFYQLRITANPKGPNPPIDIGPQEGGSTAFSTVWRGGAWFFVAEPTESNVVLLSSTFRGTLGFNSAMQELIVAMTGFRVARSLQ